MKLKGLARHLVGTSALTAAIVVSFGPSTASAADQTYDPTNVSNVWDLATLNWDGSTAAWVNGNNAIFGGTGETVDVNAAISVGNITFNSGGYIIADSTNDGTLTLAGTPSVITVTNGSDTATINEILDGTGGLTKAGAGTLVLGGVNTFTGGLTISAGTVSVAANTGLGANTNPVTLDGGSTLRFTNTTALTNTHPITIGAGGGIFDIAGTAVTGQNSRVIFNTANTLLGSGPLTVIGDGALDSAGGSGVLVVNQSHTYNGTITLQSGGMLEYANANSIAAGGSVVLGNNGGLSVVTGITMARNITVNGTGSVISFNNGNAGVISGAITLNSDVTVGLRDWYNLATVRSGTISGVISGTGGLTVNSGSGTGGTLTLTNANTYTGTTTITSSVLQLGTGGSLSTSSTIVDNGTLQFNRTNAVTQGVDFTGSAITGTGGITQLGAGSTLTLNTTNTYAGNTVIGAAGGTTAIRATASGALGAGTVSIFGNAGSNRLELSGGITLGNAIVQSGKDTTATLAAPSIINISGNNTLTGTVSVTTGGTASSIQSDAGTLTLSNATALTSVATGARIVGFKGVGDIVVSGAITNGTATTLSLEKLGTGTTTLSGTNTYTGTTTVSAGTLLVNGNNSAATGTLTVSNASTTLGGNGTVGGATTLNAGTKLSAGASTGAVGTFTFSNGLNLAAASNDTTAYIFDLASVGSSDLVLISGGTLDVGTNLSSTDFTFNQLGGFGAGTYTLFDSASALTGTVDSSVFSLGGGFNGQLQLADSGSNVVLNVTVVPEPAITLLGSLGLLGILRRRRTA